MKTLRMISTATERLDHVLGYVLSALIWTTALVCAAVVTLRYVFHLTFGWMQDLYVWTHAVVFLVGVAFAIGRGAHVRVDVFYAKWSMSRRAVVEIIGVLTCTLPWMGVLAWQSWPFVEASWRIREGSPQPNGMPGVYLLKSMLLLFAALVCLQALSLAARALRVLGGDKSARDAPPFNVEADPRGES